MKEQRPVSHLYGVRRDAFNGLLSASVPFKSQQQALLQDCLLRFSKYNKYPCAHEFQK